MNNDKVKGGILITLGACCYGMLGTYVKLAYKAGFNTAEITLSQFSLGFSGLFILTLFSRPPQATKPIRPARGIVLLTLAGSSLGLTSIFYYLAVKYIAVGVAIILLAQSVWMGVLAEAVLKKKMPGAGNFISIAVIMIGTLLATNVFDGTITLHLKGVAYGLSGAICYTATMFSTNHLELHSPPLKRSLYMILGGLLVIILVFHQSIGADFSAKIFTSWGLVIALFGTVLPPLLFTRGMPLAGMGLGAILASIEIPIAVIMAHTLLGELVLASQWIGVALIIGAVASEHLVAPISNFLKLNTYDKKN